jgi:hypothetical protein
MKTNVDGLMVFLNDNAINTEARALVAGLEPLLRRLAEIAESGRFPLAKEAGGERLKQIAGDVTLTGIQVSRCAVVSASRPFPKPEWMSEAAYRASLRTSLRASLGDSLWYNLEDSLGDRLGDSLRDSLRDSLGDILGASLRDSLGASLEDSLGDSLFCCLGFALAGDRERAERLARVVESYADGVMPLSFKRDEPNVLLVLVA